MLTLIFVYLFLLMNHPFHFMKMYHFICSHIYSPSYLFGFHPIAGYKLLSAFFVFGGCLRACVCVCCDRLCVFACVRRHFAFHVFYYAKHFVRAEHKVTDAMSIACHRVLEY